MRTFPSLSLIAASAAILLVACAHANAAASANLCPSLASSVVLQEANPADPTFPIGGPPGTGDMGGIAPQIWDLSNATDKKLEALCYPKGGAAMKTVKIPAGSTSCTFDQTTGALTCVK